MKRIILLMAMMVAPFVVTASAGGGMEGKPDNSYITVEDGTCVTLAVAGVDLVKCTLSPASPQSGLQVWICPPPVDENGDVTVVCADIKVESEEEEDK